MASTRNDPDHDLNWIPRSYEDGPEFVPRPSTPAKPLTSKQKSRNARLAEIESNNHKRRGSHPDGAALDAMSAEDKAAQLEGWRQVRAGGAAGEVVAPQQLSLDEVDSDELDPGRPF